MPERYQGQLPALPQLKQAWGQWPTTVYFVSLHNGWKVTQQSTLTSEQLWWMNIHWLLSQWEHSNSTYLALQLRNTAQKRIWGLLLQQLRSRPCLGQGSDNHRAKGRPCSISSAGSGHHKISHTSYQGDNGQHMLRKETAGIHTKKSPRTKNIKPTQATQGYSHIKLVL